MEKFKVSFFQRDYSMKLIKIEIYRYYSIYIKFIEIKKPFMTNTITRFNNLIFKNFEFLANPRIDMIEILTH